MAIAMQYFLAFYPCQYIGCIMSFAFGAFMFSNSFVTILRDELRHKKSRKHMRKDLFKFIRRHADAKQLSGQPISGTLLKI